MRRAADAAAAVVGLMLVTVGVYGIDHVTATEGAIADLVAAQASWLASVMELAFTFGLIYAVAVIVVMVRTGPRMRSALRDVLIAAMGSAVLAVVVTQTIHGEWPYVFPELGLENPDPRMPILRVVLVVATLVAASPHLGRPMRRLDWFTIGLSALAAVSLGYADPSDAIGSMGIGMLVAGSVLFAFGSPRGYPDPNQVADALVGMGLAVTEVQLDPEQTWGVRRLVCTAEDGSTLAIKAYGRDASDNARIAKAWRMLWYREGGRSVSYSRLQAVEHEALVAVMAGRAGASAIEVIAAGETSSEIALLVQRGGLPSLRDVDAVEIGDDVLKRIWQDVGRLHDASISHGSLTTSAVLFGDSGHVIRDFTFGSLVASESDRAQDVVELLFSMALLFGSARAVDAAVAGLGSERLVSTLPYLQLPAVSRGTRKEADDAKATMKEIQEAVTEVTGESLPEPVKLRRVSVRNLATALLLLLALGALVPMIAGIDFAEVWSILQDATWSLLVAALAIGQTMFIPQAMGMMFAVTVSLPFWPLVALQVAIMFIGLAVPSAAGRVAMNSAFLHKFGVGVTESVTQGAIDSFSGFLVEVSILILALLAGGFDLGIDFESGDVSWAIVILVVVGIALLTVAALHRIRRLREKVLPVIQESWGSFVAVLKEPGRAVGILTSNLVTRLVMAAVLWLILEAIHTPISFGACLVAVVATNILQGLVPVPGGIGVTETVMTGFLVALGVDENAAFAATITWRVITFYLPSLQGFFAMHWLERHEYL
ncbi:MAG TPA: flippase-like domain-containing protein [Acidimicrobiia bacterium]|nr:flippase-like domain-containing protein [Acidimicrobiia bacterium]